MTKVYILAKIIVEGYNSRYYTPMIDTGSEANLCRYNCLPETKWKQITQPTVLTGFNNEGSMVKYYAKDTNMG